MTKNNGNLGSSGCVNWIFEKKGSFEISTQNISEDNLMQILNDVEVEDINFEDDFYEIIVNLNNFELVNNLLENKSISFDGEITLIPQNTVKVLESEVDKIINLLNLLEEHEDVQKVYSNFEVK